MLETFTRTVAMLPLLAVILGCVSPAAWAQAEDAEPMIPDTPLADDTLLAYVERPDDSYGWTVRFRTRIGNADCAELILTSQTWQGLTWRHRLFVVIPDNAEKTTDALLVIEGGEWKDRYLKPTDKLGYADEAAMVAAVAQQEAAPVAFLLHVPFQPVFGGKVEDEVIAHTFDRYLESEDETWPLLLPMVKSAVRAMDAVQGFAAEALEVKIERFTVTGASKRGWTTWLTAAVDDRVMALAPAVIDMLNMGRQLPHQLAAYGGYSGRIHDYTDLDLPRRFKSARGQRLVSIVDPFAYRDRVTQPKLLMLGTNDGYWTVDALNLYWDGLRGPKYVMYVPNADHDLDGDYPRVLGAVGALHRDARDERPLPGLTWDYAAADGGGGADARGADSAEQLTVDPGEAGAQVLLWTASAPTRDFRRAKWTSRALVPDDAGRYRADLPAPAEGFSAAFAEAVYARGLLPLHLTTTVRVLGPAAP